MQSGLDGVRKNKLCVLVGVKLNNALRLVDYISFAGFFCHHIRTSRQLRQVNFAVLVGGKFFGAIITCHGLNFKNCVGNDLAGVGAVHLHQSQTRLHIIKEKQFLNAIASGQFHFLRCGVEDVTVTTGIHLYRAIGAGGNIRQKNLAKLICAELAERNTITPNLKGDAGHSYHIFAVILDDPQAGKFLVHDREGCHFARGHGSRVGRIILQPAGGGSDLFDFIRTGSDVVKDGVACKIGFGGVSHTALNVLDLHHSTGQVSTGVGQFFNAECPVWLVPVGQLRHLAVLRLDILRGVITEQVIQRRNTLIHGVISSQCQGNSHRTIRPSGKCANGGSIRIDYFKNSSAERCVRSFLQLGDFQASVGRLYLTAIAVIAVSGQFHRGSRVGIAHIVLQLTVLADFGTGGVKYCVFVDLGYERKLDAAGLACHSRGRVQNLEFTSITIAGAGGSNGGNIVVVHVNDARSCGNGGRVSERHTNSVIAYPCI